MMNPMKTIAKTAARSPLDRLLNPIGDCLTPTVARRIAKFRADAETQARIDELADKCNEGDLTAAERLEYESFVRAINLIAILQSKARAFLAKNRKSS
jgi:hypothetical protein